MPIAVNEMIVHQPRGLHVGINNRAPHELEAALFEIFAQCVGFLARGGELVHPFPAIHLGLAVHKAPNVFGKRTKFVLHVNKRPGIADRRDDLEPIADDAWVQKEFFDAFVGKARHFFRIELSERFAISFALAIDGDPTQAGLGAFEREELKLLAIVADRHAPFRVMIGNQLAAASVLPFACSAHTFAHDATRSYISNV